MDQENNIPHSNRQGSIPPQGEGTSSPKENPFSNVEEGNVQAELQQISSLLAKLPKKPMSNDVVPAGYFEQFPDLMLQKITRSIAGGNLETATQSAATSETTQPLATARPIATTRQEETPQSVETTKPVEEIKPSTSLVVQFKRFSVSIAAAVLLCLAGVWWFNGPSSSETSPQKLAEMKNAKPSGTESSSAGEWTELNAQSGELESLETDGSAWIDANEVAISTTVKSQLQNLPTEVLTEYQQLFPAQPIAPQPNQVVLDKKSLPALFEDYSTEELEYYLETYGD